MNIPTRFAIVSQSNGAAGDASWNESEDPRLTTYKTSAADWVAATSDHANSVDGVGYIGIELGAKLLEMTGNHPIQIMNMGWNGMNADYFHPDSTQTEQRADNAGRNAFDYMVDVFAEAGFEPEEIVLSQGEADEATDDEVFKQSWIFTCRAYFAQWPALQGITVLRTASNWDKAEIWDAIAEQEPRVNVQFVEGVEGTADHDSTHFTRWGYDMHVKAALAGICTPPNTDPTPAFREASVSWTPAILGADVIKWHEAGNGATLSAAAATDGQRPDAWADLSSHDFHSTQTTAGNRPTYRADAFGTGLPGIEFTAATADEFDNASDTLVSTGYSCVRVFKQSTTVGGCYHADYDTGSRYVPMARYYGGARNVGYIAGGADVDTGDLPIVAAQSNTLVCETGSSEMFRDGVSLGTGGYTAGRIHGGNFPATIDSGTITYAFILEVKRALTPTERAAAVAYGKALIGI